MLPEKIYSGLSSAKLAKAIFKADVPEEYVKEMPAETLFMVVKHNGLQSSADLIAMADIEQCKLLLDFDIWHKDELDEDHLWEWFELTDETGELKLLEKILRSVDLSIICLLVMKYVKFEIQEEATEEPPAPEYFTPDKGHTWLNINAPDSNKTFLLGRVLALIFETNAELFYDILGATGEATESEIVENGYQNKTKRLEAEGIPSDEYAYSLNAPLPLTLVKKTIGDADHTVSSDLKAIQPLVYDSMTVQPLSGRVSKIKNIDEFEAELTLIMNAAIVRFGVDISDYEEIKLLGSKVKGAINIALEALIKETALDDIELYNKVGLQKLYRTGLTLLLDLQKKAHAIPKEALKDVSPECFSTVAGLLEPFPVYPNFFASDGSIIKDSTGKLESGYQSFDHLRNLDKAATTIQYENA